MQKDISEVDIDRVIHDLGSSDEMVRAKALRRLCPCRNAWDLFAQHRDLVERLKKDPSTDVRGIALHIFEDAAEHQSEAYPTHRKQTADEMVAKKRASRFPADKEEIREKQKSRRRKGARRQRIQADLPGGFDGLEGGNTKGYGREEE